MIWLTLVHSGSFSNQHVGLIGFGRCTRTGWASGLGIYLVCSLGLTILSGCGTWTVRAQHGLVSRMPAQSEYCGAETRRRARLDGAADAGKG